MAVKNFKTSPSTIVPEVGTIMMFAGKITQTSSGGVITTTAPEGWLLCNGNTFSSSEFPLLYDALLSTSLPDLTNRFVSATDQNFFYALSPRIIGSSNHTHDVDVESFSVFGSTTSLDHNHYILSRNPTNQTNVYASNVSTANYYHDHGGIIAGYSFGSSNTVGQGNGNSQANLISNTHTHSTGSAAYPSPASYTNVANAAHSHAYYDPNNGNAGHHANSGASGTLLHNHTNSISINVGGVVNSSTSKTTSTTASASNEPKNITLNFIIKAG